MIEIFREYNNETIYKTDKCYISIKKEEPKIKIWYPLNYDWEEYDKWIMKTLWNNLIK